MVKRNGEDVVFQDGRDVWVARGHRERLHASTRPRSRSRRGPAVDPVHLRHHREPKDILQTTGGDLTQVASTTRTCSTSSRRRTLTGAPRTSVGHGPHLHHLRAAGTRHPGD
ncbi:hypothetical protein QJS66_18620 [Kocuria rhizophila]|nr:hypothetical protein QJS66_18620 [Kocuria rhizophila]